MESLSDNKVNEQTVTAPTFRERFLPQKYLATGCGSQIAYVFRWFMAFASPKCTCYQDAIEYNEWGPDQCSEKMETILDRLQANANLSPVLQPIFVRSGAKRFVKLAINRARIGREIPEY